MISLREYDAPASAPKAPASKLTKEERFENFKAFLKAQGYVPTVSEEEFRAAFERIWENLYGKD